VPDLIVRTQLASREAKLPVSRQFVGFTGGVLHATGIIAGPFVIAVLVGVLELLNEVPSIPEQ
jgi:tetrahydromethanopterin S-methyltransferase subunit F